jgi:hypothetical protein
MKNGKDNKIILYISAFFIICGFITGAISYFFGTKEVTKGEAYGFNIGDTRQLAYSKAEGLLKRGEILELPDMKDEMKWDMTVNPDWWNNKITLTFDNNAVIKITRYRICCELP